MYSPIIRNKSHMDIFIFKSSRQKFFQSRFSYNNDLLNHTTYHQPQNKLRAWNAPDNKHSWHFSIYEASITVQKKFSCQRSSTPVIEYMTLPFQISCLLFLVFLGLIFIKHCLDHEIY